MSDGGLGKLSDLTSRFLRQRARANQTVESWFFNDFPRGLDAVCRNYDDESAPYKKECMALFDNASISELPFGHPRFDGEFHEIAEACKEVKYGVKAQVFDRLSVLKKAYDTVQMQKHFFVTEFFPRLRELAEGAEVDSSDYELFYTARHYGVSLSKPYQALAPNELKPDEQILKEFLIYISSALNIIPRPALWETRLKTLVADNKQGFSSDIL